ncbi:MAG: hypothetical protein K6T99_08500 [Armatimonadetes bacterium]|nr:hypothetical protein [Armatimonadota bacterium]
MRAVKFALLILTFVAVGVGGFTFGNWLLDRWGGGSKAEEIRWVDEYQGLGERSGTSTALKIQAEPSSLTVRAGQPIRITIRLTNYSQRRLTLNAWLEPYPAYFRSNQFPLKVFILKSGKPIRFKGNATILPPHTKYDFFYLEPGATRSVNINLASGFRGGKWDFSEPGEYEVYLWYETYLTGRSIGLDAWTGRTNAVCVKIRIIAS